jgi:hypothetical protein
MPGTDLLLTKSFDVLMADVIDGKHIGQGVVDGIDCVTSLFAMPIPTGRSGSRLARGRSPANS